MFRGPSVERPEDSDRVVTGLGVLRQAWWNSFGRSGPIVCPEARVELATGRSRHCTVDPLCDDPMSPNRSVLASPLERSYRPDSLMSIDDDRDTISDSEVYW